MSHSSPAGLGVCVPKGSQSALAVCRSVDFVVLTSACLLSSSGGRKDISSEPLLLFILQVDGSPPPPPPPTFPSLLEVHPLVPTDPASEALYPLLQNAGNVLLKTPEDSPAPAGYKPNE